MNPEQALDPAALTRLNRLGGASSVREMIDLYLDYAPGRIAAAEAALAVGDLTALGQAVHPLRSGSGNLGAMGMVALAQRIEQAAFNREPIPLAPLVAELAATFTTVRASLEAARATLEP